MAGKGQRIGALRWDIVADNSQLVTKIKASNRMTKDLSRAMKATRTPMERYTKGLLDARAAIKRGAIDGKAYRYELLRLQKQLGREQAALDGNTRAVNKNTRAKILNRKATSAGAGKNMSNILGSGLSGIGAGGVGAGIGRSIGLASGGGAAAIGGAVAFAGVAAQIKALKEYSKLESDIVELQVFMGKKKGKEFADQFRVIARESSLTTGALVKNAAVIKSYGVELDNIVDFTKRLGEASGGDNEMFNQLTKAFSQINAMGRLMGQEKNQLVNAGFSLKLIAREVGIPMEQFSKHMEAGLITAQHVNDALVTATNEGGLFYGRLEAKANTLAGKWDIMVNSANEMFALAGQADSGWWKGAMDSLTDSINTLASNLEKKNKTEELEAEQRFYEDKLGITGTDKKSGYGSSYSSDGWWNFNNMFRESQGESIGGTNVSGWGAVFSGQVSLWEAMMYDESQRSLRAQERLRQQQYTTGSLKAKANAAGIFYEKDEEDFDDANIIDVITPDKGNGGTTGAALSTFSANSMDEYNFLRDKHTSDRDLAMKSLETLKVIASNTSDEPGKKGSWRSKAREGLKQRKWRHEQMAGHATDLYGWAMQGFRTDEQVRADQEFNAVGDPTGGSYDADRRRKSAEIYDKYAGEDGLLSSRFMPGDNQDRAFNLDNSEWGMYTTEVRNMTTELKAQYKRQKNQVERKEELRQIKNNVDETRGVKGVLVKMFKHMQSVQENTEAL